MEIVRYGGKRASDVRNHTATPVGSEAAAVEERAALCFVSSRPLSQVYVFGGYDGQKNHNELLGSRSMWKA